MPSSFPARMRSSAPVVGAWLSIDSTAGAELLAGMDFDCIVVDAEHSELDVAAIGNLLRAIDAADGYCGTLVRVASNDPVQVKRVLNLDPDGIIVPAVDDADGARRAVEATEYPPDGRRGVATYRDADYDDLEAAVEHANPLVLAQVETQSGLDAVESIARVDGLDGLFVGPADRSAHLGSFGEYDADQFRNAVDRIVRAGKAADVPVGTLAPDVPSLERRWDWGVDFLVAGTDLGYLATGARRHLDTYEALRSE